MAVATASVYVITLYVNAYIHISYGSQLLCCGWGGRGGRVGLAGGGVGGGVFVCLSGGSCDACL